MGKVFEPKDLLKGRRRIIRQALSDLSPNLRDSVVRVLESWQGEESRRLLEQLLGRDEAKFLLKKIKIA